MRALLPILVVLMATNCTPTPSATPQKTASANPALDTPTLLYGDEALKSRLKRALAAKGEKYEPRTKHLRGDGSPKFTNRLILETSPYLAQHAHNPVNWFPWGDEAFEVARKLGRPVFLSVGYSTCHWCHVMEEESFEDEAIAKYLNDHYVMIKVDREERPDVDAIYMRAVQILTRRGGWPMSVWLTPEGKPFYGGTYFPARDGDRGTRKGFITLLKEQYDSFKGDPAGIASDSTRLAARVQEDLKPIASSGLPGAVSLQMAVEMAGRRFDPEYGGSRGKPKFPSSFPVRTLLRYGRRAKDDNATTMALTSLSKMAAGGMYDHVAGGFHRYSTDARWLVPHFEKMLYDNALLAIAYIEGYQASGDTELLRVAREILDYVVRDMTSPEGGYYSATDADSIGPKGHREEGYYFTWTPSELERTLGPARAATVGKYYAVKPGGNFEGRSILHTPRDKADVAKQLKISVAELEAEIAAARPLLLTERNKRPAPIRDDKIQVSWNGLMLAAMARGARVMGDRRYRDNAKAAARFILDKLYDGGRLKHSYMDGRTTTVAFAEDHAFFASGLLELFEATHEPEWLGHAIRAMEQLEKLHTRGAAGGYFRTAHDAEKLLAREMQQRDGAVPAASSIALMNHLKLSSLTTDDRWRKRAEKTLSAFSTILTRSPWALEDMLVGLDYYTDTAKEVLLVLPEGSDTSSADYRALEAVLKRRFVPNHVLVVSFEGGAKQLHEHVPWAKGKPPRNDKATAYVCERGACELPTNEPHTLSRQLDKFADFPMGVGLR